MQNNTHSYIEDPRNKNIKIYINGEILNRPDAKISVFDSGFLLGDGVWEGIRLHNGRLCFLNDHLGRLYDGARQISIKIPYSKDQLSEIIYKVVRKNNMDSGVHIRVIISRGEKITPYQHPGANLGPISLVVIPEYKIANRAINKYGISLTSVKIIRGTSLNQDPKINSLSKFNCIAGCLQAIEKNVDEGLMLDVNGHVSTCNSTNFFIVKNNQVITSKGEYCLNGVTRKNIIEICREEGIDVLERNFMLEEAYDADESFVTGTFAGVIPVVDIDKNIIADGKRGSVTKSLFDFYKKKIDRLYPRQ